jgi:hypothetical protein
MALFRQVSPNRRSRCPGDRFMELPVRELSVEQHRPRNTHANSTSSQPVPTVPLDTRRTRSVMGELQCPGTESKWRLSVNHRLSQLKSTMGRMFRHQLKAPWGMVQPSPRNSATQRNQQGYGCFPTSTCARIEIPRRFILEINVVRGRPRRAAAPSRPPTTPFACWSI